MRSANETGSPWRSAGAMARALIERQHAAVAVERHDRIRQTGDQRFQEIVAALGDGDRPRQAIVLRAGTQRQRGGCRHDCESRQRIRDGKRPGQRQTGKHDRCRRDHQPHAAPARPRERHAALSDAH